MVFDNFCIDCLGCLTLIYSSEINNGSKRICGFFCADAIFNLGSKVLTEIEINIFEKGLDFAPVQNKINEPELRKDLKSSVGE